MQTDWQPISSWNLGASDEHRNYRYLPLECRLDFNPHEITRILKPGLTFVVFGSIPVWPNHHQEDIAFGHMFIQMLAEIDTKGNGIHIDKHRLTPKLLDQSVIDPTGDIGTIFTAIGD